MSTQVTLPAMGESVTEATVSRWLKAVGDPVAIAEPIVEISTDKVDSEIPSPVAGVVLELLAKEDDVVAVGAVLAVIRQPGEVSSPAANPPSVLEEESTPTFAPPIPWPDDDGLAGPASEPMAFSPVVVPEPVAPIVAEPVAPIVPPPPEVVVPPVPVEVPAAPEVVVPPVAEAVVPPAPEVVVPITPLPAPVPEPAPSFPPPVGLDPVAPAFAGGTEVDMFSVLEPIPAPVVAPLEVTFEAAPAPAVEPIEPAAVVAAPVAEPVADTQPPVETAAADEELAEVLAEVLAEATDQPAAEAPAEGLTEVVDELPAEPSAEVVVELIDEANLPPIPPPLPEDEVVEDTPPEDANDAAELLIVPSPDVAPVAVHALPEAIDPDAPYVTPLVRKLAEESGLDLETIEGSGVGGRIRKQDVIDAAALASDAEPAAEAEPVAEAEPAVEAEPVAEETVVLPEPTPSAPLPEAALLLVPPVETPAEPPVEAAEPEAEAAEPSAPLGLAGTTEKLSRMRRTIARRMVESLQVSAQLTATVEVDLTAVAQLRDQVKADFMAREGVNLTYLAFIARAAVDALRTFPKVNATIDTEAGTVTYSADENLGIAVDTYRGLMVPVIREAGDLSVTGLARKIADLGNRARDGQILPDELAGGTFTITNYGSGGTLWDTPIINQPQVAILGVGALVKRPVVVSDQRLGEIIAVRSMMYLSLSYDHRLVDGADAARFLSTMKQRLEAGDFAGEL